MSSEAPGEFKPVGTRKEIERLLGDLQSKSTVLAGLTDDHHQFLFNVRHIADDTIYADIVAPAGRSLVKGENIQILFGLPDGLYLVRTVVAAANPEEASFLFGTDVHRLQRRNNFRTLVPANYKTIFKLTSLKTTTDSKGTQLPLIDISAGGMRIKWPVVGMKRPLENDGISGVLILPSGKQVELFGVVRTVLAGDAASLQVGVEFQNLSLRDEQTILFVCVQIHREQQPLVR